MDEQECIKSDVALSCFVRALLRGLLNENVRLLPHEVLVKDLNSVIAKGLEADIGPPDGRTAPKVCQHLFQIAQENASEAEKKYLSIVKKRIDSGNLSDRIHERVEKKAQKTDFKEAVVSVYSRLAESLMDNQPYF